MDITVEFDLTGLRQACKDANQRLTSDIHAGLTRALRAGHVIARDLAPRDTGNLASKTEAQVTSVGPFYAKGQLVSLAPYASYVAYGTQPHTIRARRKKTLKFEVDGEFVYPVEVMHPGTKPDPYMAHAEDVIRVVLDREMQAAVDTWCRTISR